MDLLFVGLDVIGEHLTEINVTSPTYAREISRDSGVDIAAQVIESIERMSAGSTVSLVSNLEPADTKRMAENQSFNYPFLAVMPELPSPAFSHQLPASPRSLPSFREMLP